MKKINKGGHFSVPKRGHFSVPIETRSRLALLFRPLMAASLSLGQLALMGLVVRTSGY